MTILITKSSNKYNTNLVKVTYDDVLNALIKHTNLPILLCDEECKSIITNMINKLETSKKEDVQKIIDSYTLRHIFINEIKKTYENISSKDIENLFDTYLSDFKKNYLYKFYYIYYSPSQKKVNVDIEPKMRSNVKFDFLNDTHVSVVKK